MPKETGRKVVANNKKARHEYLIEDTVEAGLVLTGTEVKSLRQGRASLVDGGRLVGMISESDLARHVSEDKVAHFVQMVYGRG